MKHVTVNALCFTEVMFPGGRFLKQPSCTFCSNSLHSSLRMVMLLSSKARQRIISMKMRCVKSRHCHSFVCSQCPESLWQGVGSNVTIIIALVHCTLLRRVWFFFISASAGFREQIYCTSELAASALSYNDNNSPSAPPAETYPLITRALKTLKVLSIAKGINSCFELMSLHKEVSSRAILDMPVL